MITNSTKSAGNLTPFLILPGRNGIQVPGLLLTPKIGGSGLTYAPFAINGTEKNHDRESAIRVVGVGG